MANSKFLFLSIFVLILLNNVLCEDPVYGIPILHKGPRATNTCSGNNLFQCTAGCDSLMVCDGSGSEPLLTQKCQASTPYCESSATTAICQANPGTNCKTSSTYVCTGAGYFPDVSDCAKYNLCAGPNHLLVAYNCPTGYIYSSKDTMCKRGIACVRITCPTTGPVIAAYSPDPQFYYICQPNQVPMTYRCSGEGEQFISGIGCSFICPAEGNYIKDDNSYYFCYRDGVTLKYILQTCPAGTVLNKDLKRCEIVSTTTTVSPSSQTPSTTASSLVVTPP